MKTQNDHEWRDIRWRRPLTSAEEARLRSWLAAHPSKQAAWADEEALSRLLEGLPDVPLSSNFTARVCQAIAAEDRRAAQVERAGFSWGRWWKQALPRLAWGGAAAMLVLAGGHQYRSLQRASVARDMARIALVSALPPAEVFADFDTISQLATPPTLEKTPAEAPAPEAKRGPLPNVSDEALYAAF